MFKITNKTGLRKDGEMVMVNDLDLFFSIVYVHLHNIQSHSDILKSQLTNKLFMIIGKLEEMVVGSPTELCVNKLYYNQPEICW